MACYAPPCRAVQLSPGNQFRSHRRPSPNRTQMLTLRALRRLRHLAPAPLSLVVSTALAQQPPQPLPLKLDPKRTTPAITTADIMTRVYSFADDSLRDRMAATPESRHASVST